MSEPGGTPSVEAEHPVVRALMVVMAFIGLGPLPVVMVSTVYATYISHLSMVFYFAPIFLVLAYGLGFVPASITGLIFSVWQRSAHSSLRFDLLVAGFVGASIAFVFGAILQSTTVAFGDLYSLPLHEKVIYWTAIFGLPGLAGGVFAAAFLNRNRFRRRTGVASE
jgi:hypothetical protein